MTAEFTRGNVNNVRRLLPRVLDGTDAKAAAPLNCERSLARKSDPGDQLMQLISQQAEAAVRTRSRKAAASYVDGSDVSSRSQKLSWQHERRWASVVSACMEAGYLDRGDALITTRLILGMVISAAQRSRPSERLSAREIANSVAGLLRLESRPPPA